VVDSVASDTVQWQVNPPFYCPLVEVVPAPYTDNWVTYTTMALLKEIGQSPVLLKKEIPGFALNRIQYSVFAEYWRLIAVSKCCQSIIC